jgi:Domain of unknown function (DUF6378)
MDKLIEERGKTHGSFEKTASLSQMMKAHFTDKATGLADVQREAAEMIIVKLARIACGNADEVDHWKDIAGYANLVINDLDKKKNLTTQSCRDETFDT